MKKKRSVPKISAGSMADIAFLLLIFFRVVTRISEEQGILVLLPKWEISDPTTIGDDRIFNIHINKFNELKVQHKEVLGVLHLKNDLCYFLLDLYQNKQHVISLKHDRGTNYSAYIEVYDMIKAAYHKAWDTIAFDNYGRLYGSLNEQE